MQQFVFSSKFTACIIVDLCIAKRNYCQTASAQFFNKSSYASQLCTIAFLVPLRRDLGCWPAGQGLPRPPGGGRLRGPELAAGPAHIRVQRPHEPEVQGQAQQGAQHKVSGTEVLGWGGRLLLLFENKLFHLETNVCPIY